AAEETLRHAEQLMAKSAPVPPFHASAYHRSRLLFDLAGLERAGTAARRRWRARARRSARGALRSAARVAFRRTEVLRLAGRFRWLTGERRAALRLLRASLECGRALGARPEIARTCEEMGRCLLEMGGPTAAAADGLDAQHYLASARSLYEELALPSGLFPTGGSEKSLTDRNVNN